MTNGAPSARSLSAERLGQTLRRSIVGVRGAASRGTGFVALANGVIVTRQQIAGYDRDVTLELEGGRAAWARVLWVDVAHDLAFLLPHERQSLPPIQARPDLPRLGEEAFLLTSVPGCAFRLVPASICGLDVRAGRNRSFELDIAPALIGSGGPVVDHGGRVIGIAGLDLAGNNHYGADVASNLVLPIAALSRAFVAFDVATPLLEGRAPTYHCPGCGVSFGGEESRCLGCGKLLPHARVGASPGSAPEREVAPPAGSERFVRELLSLLGVVASHARVGLSSWRFPLAGSKSSSVEPTYVALDLDEADRTLRARVPVVRVPAKNHEPFYRFLLSANDQASGTLRLSLAGDLVTLSFVEPLAQLGEAAAVVLLRDLVRLAEHYRKVLGEPFEAPAVTNTAVSGP